MSAPVAANQLLCGLEVRFGVGLTLVLVNPERLGTLDLVGVEDGEGLEDEEPLVLLVAGRVVRDRPGQRLPEDDPASPMPFLHIRRAFLDVAAEALPHGERAPPP